MEIRICYNLKTIDKPCDPEGWNRGGAEKYRTEAKP